MPLNMVRHRLYLERLLVAFTSGLFLTLPLYINLGGQREVFFGKIYAIGALGTISCIAFSAILIKKWTCKCSANWKFVLLHHIRSIQHTRCRRSPIILMNNWNHTYNSIRWIFLIASGLGFIAALIFFWIAKSNNLYLNQNPKQRYLV